MVYGMVYSIVYGMVHSIVYGMAKLLERNTVPEIFLLKVVVYT